LLLRVWGVNPDASSGHAGRSNGHTARTTSRAPHPWIASRSGLIPDDVHHAREVVGEHVPRHLGRHLRQRLHQKVRRPHPQPGQGGDCRRSILRRTSAADAATLRVATGNVCFASWVAAPSLFLARRVHLDQRTPSPTTAASGSGQRTKSLRSSPLRGGKSREAGSQPRGLQ
jgi:hypothetical protein